MPFHAGSALLDKLGVTIGWILVCLGSIRISFADWLSLRKSLQSRLNTHFSGYLTTNLTMKIQEPIHLLSPGIHCRMYITVQGDLYIKMSEDHA